MLIFIIIISYPGFNPLFISHFPGGEYMLIGGCNNSIILLTKDGARLKNLEGQSSWVWCAKVHPKANVIVRISMN